MNEWAENKRDTYVSHPFIVYIHICNNIPNNSYLGILKKERIARKYKQSYLFISISIIFQSRIEFANFFVCIPANIFLF